MMRELTLRDVARITGGRLVGDPDAKITAVITDSRAVSAGALFVALRGDRFDGAIYAADAVAAGCAAAVVERAVVLGDVPHVLVSSTLRALGDLAAAHRIGYKLPVVGITGSAGKTGTREMCRAVLEALGPALTNRSNHNNLIGVPQTLLRLGAEHRTAVIEMGSNQPGEIGRLTEIARPRIGVVTLVAAAHTEKLGDIEGVAHEKGALLRGLPKDGVAVVPSFDDRVLAEAAAAPARVVRFGYDAADDLRISAETGGLTPSATVCWRDGAPIRLALDVPGRHQLRNAAAGLTVGCLLGVTLEEGCRRLNGISAVPGRTRVVAAGGLRIIDDTYNANPASVAEALRLLAEVREGRRYAALGVMAELGGAHEGEHRAAGRLAAAADLSGLGVVGANASAIADGAIEAGMAPDRVRRFEDHDACTDWLRSVAAPGDTILLKGSRIARMETILDRMAGTQE
ncbi:MAG: UDP-N-acetylmuramoyl-tripeptide--D-alanyl-D-alanine ligase [Pseudomonadota bacterium]